MEDYDSYIAQSDRGENGRKLSVVAVCEESVKGEKWKGKRRVIGYRCEKRTAIRASGNEMK